MPVIPISTILNDIRYYYGLTRITSGIVNPPVNERVFPISKYQVEKLRASSPLGELALKVENISDSNNVFVTWVSYDSTLVSTPTISYWVLPGATVNDIIGSATFPCSTARIAKDASNTIYIFLNKTKLSFRLGGGGSIPTGSSGAVVVPPPPPPAP